ncbi:MAG: histidine phosphatase family protein [Polyangiaceae bacterium]
MTTRRVFFFARHGETDWNASGRWQGQTDTDLNAVGRAQASVLAARLRGAGIRAVGSSDLSRARQTAEIVARELGLELGYTDSAFRERAYGVFEGLTREECLARHPVEWARFESDPRAAPSGVEPLDSVAGRMLIGVRHAAERMEPPALIVSHGRAIRSLVSLVTGALAAPLANGAVVRIVVENGVPVDATPLADAEVVPSAPK